MSSPISNPTQLISAIVTFYLLACLPFIFINARLAKRKGRQPLRYILLSTIPFVGYILTWSLISLTEKRISDKLQQALELIARIENGKRSAGQ